jgi:mitochondrial chaperone BCS1
MACTPSRAIVLLEDIDCAFPSREQMEEEEEAKLKGIVIKEAKKSNITMSGLLNVIDGVSSEEGRLLIATVRIIYYTFFLRLTSH